MASLEVLAAVANDLEVLFCGFFEDGECKVLLALGLEVGLQFGADEDGEDVVEVLLAGLEGDNETAP